MARLFLWIKSDSIFPILLDDFSVIEEEKKILGGSRTDLERSIPDLKRRCGGNCNVDYVFGGSIDIDSRKKLISTMIGEKFQTRSYSVSAVELVASFIDEKFSLSPSLGDSRVYVCASGTELLLCRACFDGTDYIWDGLVTKVSGVSIAPIKRIIVEKVVEKVDDPRGYLTDADGTRLRREIEGQMSNADHWYSLYNLREQQLYIGDFVYSDDTNQTLYSVSIDRIEIERAYRQEISHVIQQVKEFAVSAPEGRVEIALDGSAFEDETFTKEIRAVLGADRHVYISDNRVKELAGLYFKRYKEISESFEDFDIKASNMAVQQKAGKLWIENVTAIKSLHERLNNACGVLKSYIDEDRVKLNELSIEVDNDLKASAFDDADGRFVGVQIPNEKVREAIRNCEKLTSEHESMEVVLAKITCISGARIIKEMMDKTEEAIKKAKIDNNLNFDNFTALKSEIQRLRDCYEEYLELRRKYISAATRQEKRKIIEEILKRALTREPLPSLILRHVDVVIDAKIEVEKKFLRTKPKALNIDLKVENNDTLPCDCALKVACEELIDVDSVCSGLSYNLEKGSRSFHVEIPLPDRQLPEKRIRVRLFANPIELDQNAIGCLQKVINL